MVVQSVLRISYTIFMALHSLVVDSLLALQRIFAQSLDKSISKNNCISYAKINGKSANSNMLFIC